MLSTVSRGSDGGVVLAKVVGVPSYQHRLKDMFAVGFLCLVAAVCAVLVALMIREIAAGTPIRTRRVGYGPLAAVVFTLGMAYSVRGPWRRMQNGRLEEGVDRFLTVMTSDHTVFCGRPWETVELLTRADDPLWNRNHLPSMDDVSKFQLTENGRAVGSQPPDRVVVGPSGVYLVFVSDVPLQGRDLSLTPLPAEARGVAEELSAFLARLPACKGFPPDTFEVRCLIAFPADKLAVDLAAVPPVPRGLSTMTRLISTAPAKLSAEEREAMEFGLRLHCGDGL